MPSQTVEWRYIPTGTVKHAVDLATEKAACGFMLYGHAYWCSDEEILRALYKCKSCLAKMEE